MSLIVIFIDTKVQYYFEIRVIFNLKRCKTQEIQHEIHALFAKTGIAKNIMVMTIFIMFSLKKYYIMTKIPFSNVNFSMFLRVTFYILWRNEDL